MIILSAFSIVAFFLNAVGKEKANSNGDFYTNSTTTASCIPQPYSGQDGGNSSFLANGIVILPVTQPLDIALDSGVKGIKVAHFQLNGPWNSCDVLKEVTVHHLGDGAVSDIDNIYHRWLDECSHSRSEFFRKTIYSTCLKNSVYYFARFI